MTARVLFSMVVALILVLGGTSDVWAAQDRPRSGSDTADVAVRTPMSETLAQYRDNPAYAYEEQTAGTSRWDRLWSWIFQQVDVSTGAPWATGILNGLIVVLATVVLLFGAYWLVRARWTRPVSSSDAIDDEDDLTQKTLETVDFATKAAKAETRQAYRQAVRYHYLDLLQRLMDADLILWTSEKSNRDFVQETRDHRVHDAFARATDLFEIVWYGSASLRGSTYEQVRDTMSAVRRHLASPVSSSDT